MNTQRPCIGIKIRLVKSNEMGENGRLEKVGEEWAKSRGWAENGRIQESGQKGQ